MVASLLLRVAQVLLGGSALAILCLVLNNVVRIHFALKKFKRDSKGLPFLARTNLIVGDVLELVLSGRFQEKMTRLHKRHGKTFAWMYREKCAASTIDLELIKKLVLDEPDKHINRINLDLAVEEMNRNSILVAEDDQWRRIRKAVAPALTKQKFMAANVVLEIKNSIDKLVEAIENRLELAEELEGKSDVKVDVDDLAHRYSLNIVYSCFYKQHNLIDFNSRAEHHTHMADCAADTVKSSWLIRLGFVFPQTKPLVNWLLHNVGRQGKWCSDVMNFIKLQTKQNFEARKELKRLRAATRGAHEEPDEDNLLLADGSKFNRGLMDPITDAFHDGKLTRAEYFNTAFFLLNAADKTAADALATILYQLSADERVQEKTRAAVLAEGIDSTYLNWVVNESLRICPPAPIGCSRTAAADIHLADGALVPKGTFVLTPIYTIHRLPEYWGDDAAEFKPERWANAKSFHPCQFMPFGAGIRSCPGREFALFEIKTLLCELLARYKFQGEKTRPKFHAPYLMFLVHDKPTYIKVARV